MVQAIPRTIVDLNQQSYQRLKSALALNLRRQIFIGICDDLHLRDRLVCQLEQELSGLNTAPGRGRYRPYPYLVSLQLSLENPDPIAQISQWLAQHPPPEQQHRHAPMPAFQLVGVEHLSRHAAALQWLFLNHLRGIERSLPALESSLLLWVTRPWSRMIPQAAPTFWRCRTAVFDFIGEPTPFVSQPETFPITVGRSPQLKTDAPPHQPHRAQPKSDEAPEAKQSEQKTCSEAPAANHEAVTAEAIAETRDITSAASPTDHSPAGSTAQLSVHHLQISLDSLLPQTAGDEEEAIAPSHDTDDEHQKHADNQPQSTNSAANLIPETAPSSPLSEGTQPSSNSIVSRETDEIDLDEPFPAESAQEKPTQEQTAREETAQNESDEAGAWPDQSSAPVMPLPPSETSLDLIHQEAINNDTHPGSPDATASTDDPRPPSIPKSTSRAITLPFLPGLGHTAPIQHDDELKILDAEPKLLRGALPPSHGVRPKMAPPTSQSDQFSGAWLDNELAEVFQGNLEEEDPQTFAALQQIDRLREQQAPISVIAGSYRGLGNLYRNRIEQGDISPQNLLRAMKAYEQVLQFVSERSPIWSEVLNDMGNLCWLLSRCAPSPEQGLPHLQQGIHAYQTALSKITPHTHPQTYPMIQNNLGAAYGDMARHHNPVENLQKSLEAYQEALRYRKSDLDPMRYASTQNNLGTTYWNLAQYRDPKANLKQAIAAYTESLHHYQPDQDAINYAMIQNNLGTAYWNLSQHERSERWLRLAIESYTIALQYRTLDVNPVAYAATQNNLGTAYWHLSNYHDHHPPSRHDALHQSVVAYEAALQAVEIVQQSDRPMPINFDVLATRNNLGLVLFQIATDRDRPAQSADPSESRLSADDCLDRALDHHLAALQGWQGRPDLRQTAMNCIIQTLRAISEQKGLMGQNLVLSKIPAQLLPEILPQI